jgi:hypothetical protein
MRVVSHNVHTDLSTPVIASDNGFTVTGPFIAGHPDPRRCRPACDTTAAFAGYNRIAVNDLLTHWTPQMPELLP